MNAFRKNVLYKRRERLKWAEVKPATKVWAKVRQSTVEHHWYYWVKVNSYWICKRVRTYGSTESIGLAGMDLTKDGAFLDCQNNNPRPQRKVSVS